jgi:endogenous inhibitor of DNA gyrase (YacG/DUF329 family)
METRKCPVCNEIITGRTDKKYCSDQCRFIHNNKNKLTAEEPIIKGNMLLRKNRSILKTLCPEGRATVRKEVMDAMGYDFTMFSSLFMTSKKQLYYLCYDFGFTPIIDNGKEKALIISKQDYMNEWNPWKFVKRKENE